MMPSKRNILLRHPLILLYVLVLLLLAVLSASLEQRDDTPFSLSHSVVVDGPAPATLAIYGNAFHADLRGVLVKNLVNEKALLWHQLVEVPCRGVAVKGRLALASCYGNKLISLDLHQSGALQFLGSIDLPDTINQVKIVGNQALVGMKRHAGLSLVDLKDPEALQLGTHFPMTGLVSSLVAGQGSVYFTNPSEGIDRIDLSVKDPSPEKMVPLKFIWRIALQDKKLVVGSLKGRVHLFDVSASGQLVEVGNIEYPSNIRGVALTKEVLAVALVDGTLDVFNLSSWPNLSEPVQLKLPGRPWQLESHPDQEIIVVSFAAGGLGLVDVSRTEMPTFVGHLKLPRTFMGMALQSEVVYGASHNGLEAFSLDEIKNGKLSMLATEATIEPISYELRTWNGHVYGYNNMTLVDFGKKASRDIDSMNQFLAVANRKGISLFERHEDGQPQRFASLLLAEGSMAAKFRDNYLYVIHSGGLKIFSGVRLEKLIMISELKLSGRLTHFEILDSGYLLVTTINEGVLVVDVSDPQQPVQAARLALPRHLQKNFTGQDVLVDGQRAYISQGEGGVHVVDMSVPSQPELIQIIDTPGFARNMALYDNLLLVADGTEGIFMIDVKDRNVALPIGSLPVPLRVMQIAVTEYGLLVSGSQGGTMKLPLPQRVQNLRVISKGEVHVDVEKVEKGQYLYLYDERISGQVKVGAQ